MQDFSTEATREEISVSGLWCKAIGAVHHELKMAGINCLTMTVQGPVCMEVGDLGQVRSPAWVG